MKTKENKILFAVCDSNGLYTKGTIVIVDDIPYIFDDGYCEECDLGKHCSRKPFNCSDDVGRDDICLKKMEGGI